eukprot:352500-Chlamydomonas_euryale.AAC.3
MNLSPSAPPPPLLTLSAQYPGFLRREGPRLMGWRAPVGCGSVGRVNGADAHALGKQGVTAEWQAALSAPLPGLGQGGGGRLQTTPCGARVQPASVGPPATAGGAAPGKLADAMRAAGRSMAWHGVASHGMAWPPRPHGDVAHIALAAHALLRKAHRV